MVHVVSDREKQQNRTTYKMNGREEEIDRTEKISYRKDSISTNTINSEIAYYKTSVHKSCIVYITYFAIHAFSAVGWACIRNKYYCLS